ncbi:MAG: DNA alkylation repair protein [Myxococcales bacterium]|nr:DNA alkylation repair protein [Myxococcales bacterium]
MPTVNEVLTTLATMGTEQNRKIYARHGVSNAMSGVSFANLTTLKKQIKRNHSLAIACWDSGNHDAQVLATMIADPEQCSTELLNTWVHQLTNYVITDAFSGLAAKTPIALKLATAWRNADAEWVEAAGWSVTSILAMERADIPDSVFEPLLSRIATSIHGQKNRVRHAMNGTLTAIGIYRETLRHKALATAQQIGTVVVDHGETGCKTPHAVDYITKSVLKLQEMASRKSPKPPRKSS